MTLTMNPALDITTDTDRVIHTDKMRCGLPRYDPGGGGINVARIAHVLGERQYRRSFLRAATPAIR